MDTQNLQENSAQGVKQVLFHIKYLLMIGVLEQVPCKINLEGKIYIFRQRHSRPDRESIQSKLDSGCNTYRRNDVGTLFTLYILFYRLFPTHSFHRKLTLPVSTQFHHNYRFQDNVIVVLRRGWGNLFP